MRLITLYKYQDMLCKFLNKRKQNRTYYQR